MENKESQISVKLTVNKASISQLFPIQPHLSVKISYTQSLYKSQTQVKVHYIAHS